MRAVRQANGTFILGQFSQPFESAAHMVKHYSVNELRPDGTFPVRLEHPVSYNDRDAYNYTQIIKDHPTLIPPASAK